MGNVSHEQANLLLRLFELRREPRLREARKFVIDHLETSSPEAMMKQCSPGTENNASLRMVLSYWDMCAGIVNRGLIDEEFFFENSGEQMVVWEKLKHIIPGIRAQFKNPAFMVNLEQHATRMVAWREKNAPGSVEALKAYLEQSRAAAKAAGN